MRTERDPILSPSWRHRPDVDDPFVAELVGTGAFGSVADIARLAIHRGDRLGRRVDELLAAAVPRSVTTPEEIDALPVRSVLLCKVGEVFWKAAAVGGIWLAAGYTDTWTAAEVSEWAPLTVLHTGDEDL